jgi:hypothetical protein
LKITDLIKKYLESPDPSDPNLFYPPSNINAITEMEKHLGIKFPQDYKDFLLLSNGFDGFVGESAVSLNNISNIKTYTEGYCSEFFPDLIHIGTNGGGEMYVLNKSTPTLTYGIIPYISMPEDLIPLGETFEEFIKHLYHNDFWTV